VPVLFMRALIERIFSGIGNCARKRGSAPEPSENRRKPQQPMVVKRHGP
jgi:hypothetical protein